MNVKVLLKYGMLFLKYYELPILESESVLKNTIVKGVQEGVFGLLLNNKVWYKENVLSPEISDEVLVLSKDVAFKMKGEVREVVEELHPKTPEMPLEVPALPKAPKKALRKIVPKVKVPWDKLSDLVRRVFIPLNSEGASISLEMKIEAESQRGISKDTLDLKIKETLNQIGAEVLEEEES